MKTIKGSFVIVMIGLFAVLASSMWMGLGCRILNPAKPEVVKAESEKAKEAKTTTEQNKSEQTNEKPLWIIDHFVSETEWRYAQKWNMTIPQWVERLGYCKAEDIKKRNGTVEQGDEIEIPVFEKTFKGTASYYGYETKGTTATGKRWNPEEKLVAAVFLPKSSSIERQTVVNVTNLDNGRTIKAVEVEDSGPYAYDLKNGVKQPRVLDLSLGLKRKLGCEDLCQIRYTIRSIPSKYNTLSTLS